MKSTNKEVVAKIQQHILERLSDDETMDVSKQLQAVVEAFENFSNPYEVKRTPNRQDRFKEFIQGLPSELSVEYYYVAMAASLNDWLGTPNKKYDDYMVSKIYYALIYREFCKLCRKHSVEFNTL